MIKSGFEKRGQKRDPIREGIDYLIQGEVIKTFRPGESIDMSESGIGIVADYSLQPGQVVIIKSKEDPADVKIGIVRWSMKIGDKFRAGLRFV